MRDSVIADWAVAVAYPSKYAYGSPRDSARAGRAEPDRLGTAQAPHPTVGARTRADGTAQAPHPTIGARIHPVGAALVAGPRRSAVQRMGAEDVEGSSGRQDGTAQAPRPTGGVRTCPVGLSLADSRSASSDPGSNPWYRAGSGSSAGDRQEQHRLRGICRISCITSTATAPSGPRPYPDGNPPMQDTGAGPVLDFRFVPHGGATPASLPYSYLWKIFCHHRPRRPVRRRRIFLSCSSAAERTAGCSPTGGKGAAFRG